MIKRTIQATPSLLGPTSNLSAATNARDWFTEQIRELNLRWLLAHADNGVIWGELRDSELRLSSDAFGLDTLTLSWTTLQQARLFGSSGELRVWMGPNNWQAQLRRDGEENGTLIEYIEETHFLWGTKANESRDGFTEIVEGSQGIIHTPPISVAPKETQRAALLVRHYIAEDENGVARIVDSRLVALQAPEVS